MTSDLLGFLPALLPVALSPGASFTLVMNSALAGGRKGLYRTLTGTAMGIYTHALLIGLGITAVIASAPLLSGALHIAGTLYLLWLGIQLIRSGLRARQTASEKPVASVTVKEAWLANVLNPKAVMFYLTVVSPFAGRHGGLSSCLLLASVHILVMSVWLLAVSHTLIFSARNVDPVRLKKYVNIAGGLVLIVISVRGLIS